MFDMLELCCSCVPLTSHSISDLLAVTLVLSSHTRVFVLMGLLIIRVLEG